MAVTMGSTDIQMSDILPCVVILSVSVTFIKYSMKHSLMRLSFHDISPFSTSIIFLLASLSQNNGLKVFQTATRFRTFNGSNLF